MKEAFLLPPVRWTGAQAAKMACRVVVLRRLARLDRAGDRGWLEDHVRVLTEVGGRGRRPDFGERLPATRAWVADGSSFKGRRYSGEGKWQRGAARRPGAPSDHGFSIGAPPQWINEDQSRRHGGHLGSPWVATSHEEARYEAAEGRARLRLGFI
jgi:hypothetical protein